MAQKMRKRKSVLPRPSIPQKIDELLIRYFLIEIFIFFSLKNKVYGLARHTEKTQRKV